VGKGHLELRASVLSPEEVEEIDRATTQVLSDVGVSIASENACQLLDRAGALVDDRTGVVKIPEDLVRNSVSSARQRTVELFDRSGATGIRLEGK